jgi:hypothetical protein
VNWHLAPSGKKWSIRKSGAARASRVLESYDAAMSYWITRAGRDRSVLYIHDHTGRIMERINLSGEVS